MPSGQGRNSPRKRRKKRNVLFAPISFIIICAAMVLAMSVFFRVSKIEVDGASMYTQEEIIDASGLETGDNLFFVNRFSVATRIFSRLPYIDNVVIARSLPNKLIIRVEESNAVAYVSAEGSIWLIDQSCKVLEQGKAAHTNGLIQVTGLTPGTTVIGEIMKAKEAEGSKVSFLQEILRIMSEREMISDVARLDMSNVASPSFTYLDKFTVKVGKNEDLEYKFGLLLNAAEQLLDGVDGTIDLSIDKKAHFYPS